MKNIAALLLVISIMITSSLTFAANIGEGKTGNNGQELNGTTLED